MHGWHDLTPASKVRRHFTRHLSLSRVVNVCVSTAPRQPADDDVEAAGRGGKKREVKQAWRGQHGTTMANDFHPSGALLARMCREMRRFTAALLPHRRSSSLGFSQAGNLSVQYETDRQAWANAAAPADKFEYEWSNRRLLCASLTIVGFIMATIRCARHCFIQLAGHSDSESDAPVGSCAAEDAMKRRP